MDLMMKDLVALSDQFFETKKKLFYYYDCITKSFPLSDEQKYSVAFGILKTSDPTLQNYVDILNSDANLKKINRQLSKLKLQGVIKILQYAMECEEKISGYDIEKLLTYPLKYRNEIVTLFEGLGGVHHIYMIKGKIMKEIPAREYVTKNRRLLKYVDFWYKKLNEFEK